MQAFLAHKDKEERKPKANLKKGPGLEVLQLFPTPSHQAQKECPGSVIPTASFLVV